MSISGQSLPDLYRGKTVLITGNTGFKGSWLTLWLLHLNARVFGYSLPSPTEPSLFETLQLGEGCRQYTADVRDFHHLWRVLDEVRPDIIFHLAAQSLVRESHERPLETFYVNTAGSVNLLEAVRRSGLSTSVVMVTSDKCYHNQNTLFGYRESDPMGGHDPYSSSKGAAELLIDSWRRSFFDRHVPGAQDVRVASARAGNVIGGGDWAKDRILPDCMRGLNDGGVVNVRNPHHTRPWQHVLEPLYGYLVLGAHLMASPREDVSSYTDAFNFGPAVTSNRSVATLAEAVIDAWGSGKWVSSAPPVVHHESTLLNLNSDKSYHLLNWFPVWDFHEAVHSSVEWYKRYYANPAGVSGFTLGQIDRYLETVAFRTSEVYAGQA